MKKITFSLNKMNEAFKLKRGAHNDCNCKDTSSTSTKQLRHKRVTHCIFDVDGTMIDSQKVYTKVLGELCVKYGKPFPDEVKLRMAGVTKRKLCKLVIEELKLDVKLEELEKQFSEMARAGLPNAPYHKGVYRLVTHLHKNKIPIAAATNTPRATFLYVVKEKLGFFAKFSHTITIDDVQMRGKPNPDLYLMTAAKFSSHPDPSACLVFEDSTPGLRAALAAKMQVVITPHLHKIDQQYLTEKITILANLCQFKPEHYGLPPFAKKTMGSRRLF